MVPGRGCDPDVVGMQGARHGASRPCCRRGGGGGLGAFAEPAALAALVGRTGHGYDLRREISDITNGEIEVDAGGLYRVLRRLEEEGFVTSEWCESEAGPQRREYRLTEEGRELAEDWVAHLRERERLSRRLADALGSALGSVDDT
ncbi:MAG: PadR family transcriptional regulator [Coriobacteriia bacterium]|nr:PadR family transcriptional regulator [Coriobacteriia bacterium]